MFPIFPVKTRCGQLAWYAVLVGMGISRSRLHP
jgi:hypothetical protein